MDSPNNRFSSVIALDFEFHQPDGERPEPICLVAKELMSGVVWRFDAADLSSHCAPPFSVGPGTLILAYYASAEMSCFRALGWPMPENLIDLYVEFRCQSNGLPPPPGGRGLLGALKWFGIEGMTADEKSDMRALAIRGGPFTREEMSALLHYCEADVDALAALWGEMESTINRPQALHRGDYMQAVSAMEWQGTPIDMEALHALQDAWADIQLDLIRRVDSAFDVYEGTRFSQERFANLLARRGYAWPRHPSGQLDLSEGTFRDMARRYPELESLRQLRSSLGQMRLSVPTVGKDGCNRCLLSPFSARTGRNQPSSSKFIFGPSSWMRSLIRPPEGHGLAYIDWSQQEFGIAAALSGDAKMMEAYCSGDPYLSFAKQAGAAPAEATKASHGEIRDQFKACVLAVQYGMGEASLALRIGQPIARTRELLLLHRETYRTFWGWSDGAIDYAMLTGSLHTVFGWQVHVGEDPNPRSLRNFPMQANGAEMLRLACCLIVEAGIKLCAPVHDAVLIMSPLEALDRDIARCRQLMADASRIILNGFSLHTEVDRICYPERYQDKRGIEMWETVWECIASRNLENYNTRGYPLAANSGAERRASHVC